MKIAIIPARKGSKRCPNKNIELIQGVPLFDITIQQAIRLNFERVIVSTDDLFIIEYVKKKYCRNEVIIHERDDSLSNDFITLLQVIQSIIKKYRLKKYYDLYLIQVTNPLRSDNDIKQAEKLYDLNNKNNSVVSVAEMEYPVETTLILNSENKLQLREKVNTIRKQAFKPSYRWNDGLIIDSVARWLSSERILFGDSPIPYIMPPERSFYIDYPWQLEIIKLLIENNKKNT
jgi:CMP-N,N'-diacetyllegionaminic acid synthase